MEARWESQTRYYLVKLHQDLLGDWVLTTAHGGRKSERGALRIKFVETMEKGLKEIQSIHKKRIRHGYARVF